MMDAIQAFLGESAQHRWRENQKSFLKDDFKNFEEYLKFYLWDNDVFVLGLEKTTHANPIQSFCYIAQKIRINNSILFDFQKELIAELDDTGKSKPYKKKYCYFDGVIEDDSSFKASGFRWVNLNYHEIAAFFCALSRTKLVNQNMNPLSISQYERYVQDIAAKIEETQGYELANHCSWVLAQNITEIFRRFMFLDTANEITGKPAIFKEKSKEATYENLEKFWQEVISEPNPTNPIWIMFGDLPLKRVIYPYSDAEYIIAGKRFVEFQRERSKGGWGKGNLRGKKHPPAPQEVIAFFKKSD